MDVKKEIERHRLPCGAATISIDGVCRRRLRDKLNFLLDALTSDVHPTGVDEDILSMEEEVEIPEEKETEAEKKKRLIREGKMKAEVKHEVEKYKEKLQGNSKLLQNITGKINKR